MTHQPKMSNIKYPTPILLDLCLDDLFFDEEIKEHDVVNQWKQRNHQDAHKPFHSKIDDYLSNITLQSTTDYLVREAISIVTKHLTNTHMSTVQRNKKASLSIVNEGHRRPQEWSGESAEPWARACLLSVLTHSVTSR